MNLQKICWKIFFQNSQDINSDEFIKLFNAWIPNSKDIFIDVADYKHAYDGPLVLLAGHYADYILDATHHKMGLVYKYKKPLESDNTQKLKSTLKSLFEGCNNLQSSKDLKVMPQFDLTQLEIVINDRAALAHTKENLAELQKTLQSFFQETLGINEISFTAPKDPRQRAGFVLSFSQPLDITTLSKKLA